MSKLKEDLAYALLSNNPIDTIIEIKKGVPTEKLHETLLQEYEPMEEPLAHVIFKSCKNKYSYQNKNPKENIADVLLNDFNPEQMLKLAYSEDAEKQKFLLVLSQYGKDAIKMLLKGQDAKTKTKLLEEDVGGMTLKELVKKAMDQELSSIAFKGIGNEEFVLICSKSETGEKGKYIEIGKDNEVEKFSKNLENDSSTTINVKPNNTVTMKTVSSTGETEMTTIKPDGEIFHESWFNDDNGKLQHLKRLVKSTTDSIVR